MDTGRHLDRHLVLAPPNCARSPITLRIECKPDWNVDRWEGLAETLHNRLALAHEGLNFRIERAGTGELPRFELKAKRTVDKRDAPIGAST